MSIDTENNNKDKVQSTLVKRAGTILKGQCHIFFCFLSFAVN